MTFVVLLAVLLGVSALIRDDGTPRGSGTRRWVWLLVLGVAAAGLLVRVVGLDRSLWIDEFGTLWAIEGTFHESWSRGVAFHGQSPLYYTLLWPLIRVAGESEGALRLPSLVCGAVAAFLVYRTAKRIRSIEAGLFAGSLAWVSPVLMESSVSARPYALAVVCAAVAFHGFVLAVQTGGRRSRLLFVVGGAGLFLTHYVSSLVMLGVAAGYLSFRDLRTHYRWPAFLVDVTVQLGAVVITLPQLDALWARRGTLDWIGPPDYLTFIMVLGPFLLPVLVARLYARDSRDRISNHIELVLALAIGAQVGAMTLLALFGTNLLAPRYLTVIAVPASLLAGLALSRLRTPVASISIIFAMVLVTALSVHSWRVSGVPTTLVNEDWRGAAHALHGEMSATPGSLVLYRPGFVEQEPGVTASPVLAAPLRSPGFSAPDWPIVPLTFSWWSAAREPYFRRVLLPALNDAEVFFVLIGGTTPKTGDYGRLLLEWIEMALPRQFSVRSLGDFRGVSLLRFDRRRGQVSRR